MGDKESLEGEELEDRVGSAARGVVAGLGRVAPSPKEIILRNGGKNTDLFRTLLESELRKDYDIPVSIDSESEGYVVDISDLLRFKRY